MNSCFNLCEWVLVVAYFRLVFADQLLLFSECSQPATISNYSQVTCLLPQRSSFPSDSLSHSSALVSQCFWQEYTGWVAIHEFHGMCGPFSHTLWLLAELQKKEMCDPPQNDHLCNCPKGVQLIDMSYQNLILDPFLGIVSKFDNFFSLFFFFLKGRKANAGNLLQLANCFI